MNAWRTPQQVYPRHMADEFVNLGVHARSSAPPAPVMPAPVMPAPKDNAEALSASFENGPRLNNDQGTSPARPQTGQYEPKQPVPRSQPRAMGSRPLENADLVLQGEVFKDQIPALPAPSSPFSKPCHERPHRSDLIRIYARKLS